MARRQEEEAKGEEVAEDGEEDEKDETVLGLLRLFERSRSSVKEGGEGNKRKAGMGGNI